MPVAFSSSSISGDPDATCVHVVGELDIATAAQLDLTLGEAQSHARLVVLDLGDLAFIDGAGLRAIVRAASRARLAGRRLVLIRCPANVQRLIRLTRTADQLEIAVDAVPGARATGPRRLPPTGAGAAFLGAAAGSVASGQPG